MPKVSVIIPVYNAEKYLRQCLDSVVNQTLKEIEIICIDDCSTDTSADIIREYQTKDARIIGVFYNENKSASQARKDGVLLSTGEYIMFLDADDSFEESACEELSSLMDLKKVDMIQFGTYVDALPSVNTNTVNWFIDFSTPYKGYLYGTGVFLGCFSENKFGFNLWNKIYTAPLCKKAFAQISDGFYPKAQDLYAFFILAWEAKSYLGIEKKYYHYNYGRGITGDAMKLTLEGFKRNCYQSDVAEKIKEFLISQNSWNLYRNIWLKVKEMLEVECLNLWIDKLSVYDRLYGYDILIEAWGKKDIDYLINNIFQTRRLEISLMYIESMIKNDKMVPLNYEKVIPIVFATNDLYAPYAAVAIQSVLAHASENNYYRIYVLFNEISETHRDSLQNMSNGQATIRCINISDFIDNKNVVLYERGYFTKEMYYRFIIPELFSDFDKVVYLDCDLVVCSDVADMIPADMGDSLIAGVKNLLLPQTRARLNDDFGIEGTKYINSGVLVFDIKNCKKEYFTDSCFEALNYIPHEKLICCDQDIINLVCKDKIYYLDDSWNFLWHMLFDSEEYVEVSKSLCKKIGNNFKILHFASSVKPWKYPDLPLSRHFWEHARNTSFYEEILMNNVLNKMNNTNGKNTAINSNVKSTENVELLKTQVKNLDQQLRCLGEQKQQLEQEIINITNSKSFRLGRIITFIPRKIRGGIRCYKEHGFKYTFNRILIHLHLKNDKIQKYTEIEQTGIEKKVIKDYNYYKNLPQNKYKDELKEWFKNQTGMELDLENPKTFNEKIQWLKLYDSTPEKTKLADKYEVREWIKQTIGEKHLIPLLGVWDCFDDIDFDKLPNQFVLKTNHGSGWNLVVRDKSKFDIIDAKNKFDSWMSKNFAYFAGLELHYLNIQPKIIAEKYIADLSGNIFDYKFSCFNGVPKFVWVDIGCGTNAHFRNIYNLNWELQDYKIHWPSIPFAPEKPDTFEKMVELARLLCQGFAFVRIDFYSVNGNIYFGEMTFTSHSGIAKFDSEEVNNYYGNLIKLPQKSPIPKRKVSAHIKGGIRCYKEHGIKYTFKRTLEHFGIPMGIELAKK